MLNQLFHRFIFLNSFFQKLERLGIFVVFMHELATVKKITLQATQIGPIDL
jgi:hypothetical protein